MYYVAQVRLLNFITNSRVIVHSFRDNLHSRTFSVFQKSIQERTVRVQRDGHAYTLNTENDIIR